MGNFMRTLIVKDKLWVQFEGKIFALPLNSEKSKRTSSAQEKDLIAPFSCKVLKIFIKPGQTLKKGDPVVVVEAMKMEYSYTSPRDGIVESVGAAEGEIVKGGTHFLRWREK
jgi:3-methylcrotonyl-CoA carboxylase alpha subunit